MENNKYSGNQPLSEAFMTILLIEDNEDDAVFLRELLSETGPSEKFRLIHRRSLSDGLSQSDGMNVELILLDLGLPECSGLETLHRVLAVYTGIPIVVLSGFADKSTAIRALKDGAQDYLVKGQIQSENLWRCMHYAMERHRLQNQIKQQAEKARAAEERFRRLIELNVDGMVIVDADKRVRLANHAAEHFFGKSADDLVGHHFDNSIFSSEAGEITLDLQGGEVVAECRYAPISWEGNNASLVSIRDITERKELEKKLYKLANYDSLTGVYNRRVFFDRLKHELEMTKRYGQPLSVLMKDIDQFKRINDTYGHQAGDMVLKHLADLCQRSLRTTDVIGRLGGEEFGVILPQTDLPGARKVGERLRQIIEESRIDINNTSLAVSITIGIAPAENVHDPGLIMDRADQALYKGKAAGRNQVVCA